MSCNLWPSLNYDNGPYHVIPPRLLGGLQALKLINLLDHPALGAWYCFQKGNCINCDFPNRSTPHAFRRQISWNHWHIVRSAPRNQIDPSHAARSYYMRVDRWIMGMIYPDLVTININRFEIPPNLLLHSGCGLQCTQILHCTTNERWKSNRIISIPKSGRNIIRNPPGC